MDFEKYASKDTQLPLGKILIGVSLMIGLCAFGVHWYGTLESNKKADEMMVLAKDAYRLEHYATALEKANKALQFAEKPEALELKSNILINQNKVFEAEDVLKKLIEKKPDNAHYYYMAATMALNETDYAKAVGYIKQAVEKEPNNTHYAVAQANLTARSGNESEAKTLYETLVKQDPKNHEAWDQYAVQANNAGEHDRALAIVTRALKEFPNDSNFYFLQATSFDYLKQHQAAAKAYYRSLELEPTRDSIAAKRYHDITGKHVPLALEQMTRDEITFESHSNVMFIDAEVNGRQGRFLLDTGASSCVMFKNKAALYGVKPGTFKVAVSTAGGTIQVPLTHANVALGRSKMDNVVFGVIPDQANLPADGIIGMNFLQNFHIDINKSSQKITLTH